MPDRDVRTIEDLIFYQYSKIIAKSAFSIPDGEQAKKQHYGFIKKTFRQLKSGEKSWSDIIREDLQLLKSEKKCDYCGSTDNLSMDHIVPGSLRIKPECEKCDTIQAIHNQVLACKHCNSSKGTMGLYEFFQTMHPAEKKFYDRIPKLLEKKYLKTIYNCHNCAGTLAKGDLDGDGKITVLDIDHILHL
jgi:hypothetical protein